MQKHGRYYELFTTQAKRYVEGEAVNQPPADQPHRRRFGPAPDSSSDMPDMPDLFQSPPDT